MRGGVVKSWRTRRPPLKRPKLSQEKLLDAVVAGEGIGMECPRFSRKKKSIDLDLTQGTTAPFESDTRQPDAASDIRSSPAQRVRSTRTDPQRPRVKDEKADQTAQKLVQPTRTSPGTRLPKRQIDGDGDDNERQLKRARLTRKNLARFNEMAKKKGTNKGSASASAPPDSTVDSSATKTTSTTSSGFADKAYKNGILHPRHSKPPTNLDDIRQLHARSRVTASPPESEYKRYVNSVEVAPNEATMVYKVGGKLLKEYDDKGYHQVFNQAFTGFPKDVGFNNGLSAPQPDFVEGLEKQEYDPFPVDEHVEGAVLYKDDPFSLALPHMAGEWKGRGGDMEEARLQSAYDGAALVHARNQALSLIGKPDPPGHAEVTTFTTDGTNLNFYAHYAAPSDDGRLKYHQYQYASANVKDSHQGHKDGRKGLRNYQDRARKQSYDLKYQLKEHWKQRCDALQTITEAAPLHVAGDTYEETKAGYEIVEQPCQPTPAASSRPRGALSSVSSSQSPPTSDYVPGSAGQKRKASPPSSRESSRPKSKGESYWEWDDRSGRYFHEHADGRVTWAKDDSG
ncbi:hypothetical protein QBC46DRAFT_323223 [Diplogelasinospora grovesii]|uniref:WW domain-containing protein n=1 Tax=Diplogelasinospora grovesii TaxID=303347 RepID=A0AAN6S0N9_9PEZI|nr:hypothetical protein QBC46DRAFT_323223 [Diplogelasinospora grovesii]